MSTTQALFPISPLSPRRAGLAHLPADVFVEIARFLNVYDILGLRLICRRLDLLTRQRPVWQNALNHACAQHGLPRFLPLLQALSDEEIEHYACRPAKFQVVLDNFTVATSSRRRPWSQYELPQDECADLRLVTGGKWLVTLTTEGSLRVWDLEPYHRLAPGPSSSKAVADAWVKPPPMLCGEGRFPARSTLMDARLSEDGAEVLTFLHSPRTENGEELSDVSVSSLDIRGCSTWSSAQLPIAVQMGSVWSHDAWNFGLNTTASFSGPWAIFTHKTWGTGETAGTWIWNWKRNLSKRVILKVSSETDGLFRTKIIADYLVTAHKAGRKLVMNVYPLTAIQWEDDLQCYAADPTSPSPSRASSVPYLFQDLEYSLHETPPPGANPSSPPTPDFLTPLFTTKFHGLHHVEQYHARGERPSNSSSAHGFVHRRSGNSVPFNVATVSISDPYWLTPPRPRYGDRGSFRIAIAVESKGEAAFRTRLQYYIRLDLNSLVAAYTLPSLPIITAPSLGSGGGTDVGVPSELGRDGQHGDAKPAYPRLRGRVSSAREAMYFHDRLFVFAGRKKIVSLWSATDGVHAHSSPLFKPGESDMKEKAGSPPVGRTPSSPTRHVAGRSRQITFRQRSGNSSQSVPIRSSTQADRASGANADTFVPLGDDLVIFTWPRPKSRNSKARVPRVAGAGGSSFGRQSKSPTPDSSEDADEMSGPMPDFGFGVGDYKEYARAMDEPPEPNIDGLRRDLLGNRLAMMGDVFSGRIVVLDELELETGRLARRTVVRVLDYV